MNFDSRYLIRWGMPGWLFLLWVYTKFIIDGRIKLTDIDLQLTNILSNVLIFTVIGLIVGFIIYQIYFSLSWLNNGANNIKYTINVLEKIDIKLPSNKLKKYYYTEYLWHSNIIKMDEYKMNYLAERYRHLLNKKHDLGSIMISLIICLPVSFAMITDAFSLYTVGYCFLNLFILFTVIRSFYYYSRNLDYFMAEVLKDLLSSKNNLNN
ncbi:hypothetical protein [Ornithinibacillus bavariensis]|uniref:hypothetical protein n=1 Tax=Ornithinibacillus bavariensis TaxID=545502 RepID=UPI000EE594C8|nr:hypothetical protein [Ornithinibacillus sp.]